MVRPTTNRALLALLTTAASWVKSPGTRLWPSSRLADMRQPKPMPHCSRRLIIALLSCVSPYHSDESAMSQQTNGEKLFDVGDLWMEPTA